MMDATPNPVSVFAPTASSSSALLRRKRVRKRNVIKRNDSKRQGGGFSKNNKSSSTSGNSNSNSNSTVPPPPQIKITIRNIKNAEKLGSVRSVLEELVAKLMDSCIEKKSNDQYVIELDRPAVRYLITEEEKVNHHRLLEKARIEEEKKKLEEEKKKQEEDDNNLVASDKEDEEEEECPKKASDSVDEENENTGVTADSSSSCEMNDGADEKKGPIVYDNNKLDTILAPKIMSNLPTITARPLYVVPPRKTSRRGERAGTAFVLLIGPKIQKERPSPTHHITMKKKAGEGKEKRPVSVFQPPHSVTLEHKLFVGADGDGDATVAANTNRSAPVDAMEMTNYPRELAKGRLLLSNVIKSLSQLAAVDSKTEELFSGCIVEQSMNGKTWKMFQNKSRPDRREGTINGTVNYKEWLETIEKQKEELKARPKPVPGGGGTTTATTSTTAGGGGGEIPKGEDELDENGQTVSSLVQHLRLEKQDAKRKKTQKKKEESRGNKFKKNKEGRSDRKRNKSRADKEGSSKRKKDAVAAKKAKRKKKAAAAKKKLSKASTLKQPTALLKPTTVTTSVGNTKT